MQQSVDQARELVLRVRRDLDVSQEGLARLLAVSSRTVSRWEAGKSQPDEHLTDRLHRLQAVVAELRLHLSARLLVRWLSDRHEELDRNTPVELLVNDFGTEAVKRLIRKNFQALTVSA